MSDTADEGNKVIKMLELLHSFDDPYELQVFIFEELERLKNN